jgi:hypothetical protein
LPRLPHYARASHQSTQRTGCFSGSGYWQPLPKVKFPWHSHGWSGPQPTKTPTVLDEQITIGERNYPRELDRRGGPRVGKISDSRQVGAEHLREMRS